MKISLLVPTLGDRYEELNRLFKSLCIQSHKNFEIVVISQSNHSVVDKILLNYKELDFKHINTDVMGLSSARNLGLKYCTGKIVMLSDDDCWYLEDSLQNIIQEFLDNQKLEVLLTKIYDPINSINYKLYDEKSSYIKNKFSLLSKSSIEIAFRYSKKNVLFDENFGLGGRYISGEEVDFLIANYRKDSIYYYSPKVTVYHLKKTSKLRNKNRIIAKGALYSKNFNIIISCLIVLRDFIKKRENNFLPFFEGYFDHKKKY